MDYTLKGGFLTMHITVAELKSNLEKYLHLAAVEDIYIMRSGRVIAKLSSPDRGRANIIKFLLGQSKLIAADEEVMAVSARLCEKNRIAYEILVR